jgi:hypothetical protein
MPRHAGNTREMIERVRNWETSSVATLATTSPSRWPTPVTARRPSRGPRNGRLRITPPPDAPANHRGGLTFGNGQVPGLAGRATPAASRAHAAPRPTLCHYSVHAEWSRLTYFAEKATDLGHSGPETWVRRAHRHISLQFWAPRRLRIAVSTCGGVAPVRQRLQERRICL